MLLPCRKYQVALKLIVVRYLILCKFDAVLKALGYLRLSRENMCMAICAIYACSLITSLNQDVVAIL